MMSYDGSEERDKEFGVDQLLISGQEKYKKALSYFKANEGDLPPVSSTILPKPLWAGSKKKEQIEIKNLFLFSIPFKSCINFLDIILYMYVYPH